MKRLLSILLMALMLYSCEQEADIPIPETEPKIALACFLSPEKPIQAVLTRVNPLFGQQPIPGPDFIEDAIVFIIHNEDTAVLTYNIGNFYEALSSPFVIKKGETYRINASAPGLPNIYAECKVPIDTATDFDLMFTSAKQNEDSVFKIQLAWNDVPNEQSFYRVSASMIDSTNVGAIRNYSFTFPTGFYTDLNHDNQLIFSGTGSFVANPNQVLTRKAKAFLITCDVNYYRYHLSLETNAKGNPFQEPISLYSNVVGGVGCFGAYIEVQREERIF